MTRLDSRGRRPAKGFAVVLAAVLFAGSAVGSRAGAAAETTGEGSASGSSGTILTRYGIRPRYDSSFRVNRKEQSWDQRFSRGVSRGPAKLDANLNVKTREDETRNNFEEGANNLQLGFSRTTLLGNLGLTANARRRFTQTTQSLHSRNSDQLVLTNAVPLHDGEAAKLDLRLGLGWIEEREVKENRRLTTTVDRTVATGWEGDGDLRGQWATHEVLSLEAGTSWNGSVQSSRTTHTEEDVQDSFRATDHSRDNRAFANLEWDHSDAWHLLLKTNWGDALAQYYQASAETQETKRYNSRSFQLTADGSFAERFGYAAKVSADRREFDYEVESNDKLNASSSYELSVDYWPTLPLLRGGTLSASAARSNKRSVLQRTTPSDIEGTRLEAKFLRPLGERLSLALTTRGDLEQYFYDDGSQDRDRLRLDNQVFLRYKGGQSLRARLGYSSIEIREVQIPQERAGQSQVKNNYRITADYDADLPAGVRISQNFQISASYTYYVYDENRNSLRRSNRVTTRLEVPLIENSSVSIKHIYEKGDRGSYRYPEGGGGRVYNKNQSDLRQNLGVDVEYTIAGMITLRATEDLRISSREQLATERLTRREDHSFSGFVGLRRSLENGMTVTANFERTESNNEDPYWRIDARVQKTFD